MSENKLEQFARQGREAAGEIATWPRWMQRNLEPPTVFICDCPHGCHVEVASNGAVCVLCQCGIHRKRDHR